MTFEELLGGRTLTEAIRTTRSGIPNPLPPAFFANPRNVQGNTSSYRKFSGRRETARIVQYGSPAVARDQVGFDEVPIKLLHSFEFQDHSLVKFENMARLDGQGGLSGPDADAARSMFAEQTREFKQLFTNLRIASTVQALALGAVYFDGSGNLLPSSSGAVTTIDYSIPAGNQSQLDVLGDGDIISADWDEAGTDIATQIINLKDAAVRLTGYPIMHAFYGSAVPGYLANNTEMASYLTGNPQLALQRSQGVEIPNGTLGLQWHPMHTSFFVDSADTNQLLWASDKVVFTPEPDGTWWEVQQGSYVIPRGLGAVTPEATAMLQNVMRVFGQFGYATLTDNPLAIRQYAGDTFLPIIKNPSAVFIADVKAT